ncbi:MAG TPA: GTP-binding protein [Bryobacteraceae bacterium]|jgi:hypothetical protein|nr:GTP-binding protein [Bryobacteraceae bacterium]
MQRPTLVFIGGFLGAGKTTLMLRAAEILLNRRLRPALITNDQSRELVDTALATTAGFHTAEIAGGCFCCRFTDLIARIEDLARFEPQVILAEPVGSCTDISATVLQPIKALYRDRLHLAPFTVLVDPARAHAMAHKPDALTAYLFRNQIAEADFVCLNKVDLQYSEPALSGGIDFLLSAQTGFGVAQWLDAVLAGGESGKHILNVDYEVYAAAEAELGWLNWHAHLESREPLNAASLIGPFLDLLDAALTRKNIPISHCKILDRTDSAVLKASICHNGEEPFIHGDRTAAPASSHEIILNLRAEGDPLTLRDIVAQLSNELPGTLTVKLFDAFRPAPPVPHHRFTHAI